MSGPVDVDNKTRLGRRLLGAPRDAGDPQRGAELLTEAADAGGAEASALVGVLAGAGVCRPQSWDTAFDYLELAARRGWPSARAQLELLAAPGAAAGAIDDRWRRLRAATDLGAWLTPPAKRSLCETPRIRAFENFLPESVCAWLIEGARGRLKPAQVYDATSGRAAVEHSRTNREMDFNIVEADLVLLLVRARIALATGLPPAVLELTKVLHYAAGERFEPHFDFIDPAVPAFGEELAARGQRLATLLVYLNDDYEGGETEFLELGLRHRGRTGEALLFANVDRAGQPDRRTLHAGRPPSRGEKWLLSQWVRDRAPAPRGPAAAGC